MSVGRPAAQALWGPDVHVDVFGPGGVGARSGRASQSGREITLPWAARYAGRACASVVRLKHDRVPCRARVGARGLGGVSVMRAARGWDASVARAAAAEALVRVVSPVRPQREVGTRDRGARGRVRCSGSLPIGPVARGEGVGAGHGSGEGGGRPSRSLRSAVVPMVAHGTKVVRPESRTG